MRPFVANSIMVHAGSTRRLGLVSMIVLTSPHHEIVKRKPIIVTSARSEIQPSAGTAVDQSSRCPKKAQQGG